MGVCIENNILSVDRKEYLWGLKQLDNSYKVPGKCFHVPPTPNLLAVVSNAVH